MTAVKVRAVLRLAVFFYFSDYKNDIFFAFFINLI